MPCNTGSRERIQEGKRWYREERAQDATDPFRIFWRDLVERVHESSGGVAALSEAERLYFAVGLLEGEVYNGGFDQFFFNSSGSHYEYARRGLEELGAVASLGLLDAAKELLFPFSQPPSETTARREALRAAGGAALCRLDALDAEFWKDPDGLGPRLQRFALERGLVEGAAQRGDAPDEGRDG